MIPASTWASLWYLTISLNRNSEHIPRGFCYAAGLASESKLDRSPYGRRTSQLAARFFNHDREHLENHQWCFKRKETPPLSWERHSPHLRSNKRGHLQHSVSSRPWSSCSGSVCRQRCTGNRGAEQGCRHSHLYRHGTCRSFAAGKKSAFVQS